MARLRPPPQRARPPPRRPVLSKQPSRLHPPRLPPHPRGRREPTTIGVPHSPGIDRPATPNKGKRADCGQPDADPSLSSSVTGHLDKLFGSDPWQRWSDRYGSTGGPAPEARKLRAALTWSPLVVVGVFIVAAMLAYWWYGLVALPLGVVWLTSTLRRPTFAYEPIGATFLRRGMLYSEFAVRVPSGQGEIYSPRAVPILDVFIHHGDPVNAVWCALTSGEVYRHTKTDQVRIAYK